MIKTSEKKSLVINSKNFCDKFNNFYNRGIPFIFLIDYNMKEFVIEKLEDVEPELILFDFPGANNVKHKWSSAKYTPLSFSPISYETYKLGFDYVKDNLIQGNSYLTNFTCKTEIFTNLSLNDIFLISKAKYRVKFLDKFVCFSPETFVKVDGDFIYTYPMKGTISADLPNAKDKLLNDEKEMAEHITIVDLLRNDLNMIAEDVTVTKFRYVSGIISRKNKLWQTSSEIRGRLRKSFKNSIGESLLSLLPAGSVTGAPKKETVKIIKNAEKYDRGFYTGIAGVFDGKILDSCVLIRFIENDNGKFFYKSGGGITVYSDCQREYKEMLDKIYVPTF
ncbi:aminodeoxychorismate synthase component I [Deferribacterales bacterium Es71-Z0220]|uniref:aminodeoxychorismate synthase component I n=1 Tax=Deferrivibrio essentukiensis TaxID=2880922 RepID=UPI001F60361B|nr:aminodeoxychorismate synthase component I [Deferrivibrio essentukiensis]MCB4203431.1 aminodeoxychorismate synthase component I [Deferrivibrio essentukiensis]